jgi:hypothetical protein
MIQSLPGKLKGMRSAIKIKSGKGESMTLAVGVFRGTGIYLNRRGQKWDPYMLLYWHNYGTLSNRASRHWFQYNRRRVSRRWRGGIMPGMFIERAWQSSAAEAQRIFEQTYEIEHNKFLEKLANK